MSEPFLAEIRMVGFNFAPRGWAFCDGQILPINQNQSLYSLLGTTYGGDGRTSFALPDLRSRTPIHVGSGHAQGQKSGEENHTLLAGEMAAHSHTFRVSDQANTARTPLGNVLSKSTQVLYRDVDSTNTGAMNGNAVLNAGGGQQHNNMQPYTTVNFCIALQGLFPSRN